MVAKAGSELRPERNRSGSSSENFGGGRGREAYLTKRKAMLSLLSMCRRKGGRRTGKADLFGLSLMIFCYPQKNVSCVGNVNGYPGYESFGAVNI